MTSGSPLPNLLMLRTLSLPSTLLTPLPHPRPPPAPPHDVVGVVVKRGGYFLLFSPVFSPKTLPLALLFHFSLALTSSPLLLPYLSIMSNTVNSTVPITFVPSSAVSSPESIYQSLTLT